MQLRKKLYEVVLSVFPVVLIVLVLHLTVSPMDSGVLIEFLTGAMLLILGLTLFNYGSGFSVVYMGERIGQSLTKSRKVWLIVLFGFITGFIVTFAEPDLQVLAQQVSLASGGSVARVLLTMMVSVGVGIFVAGALFRVVASIPLRTVLLISYAVVFVLALIVSYVSPDFVAVAFDSGGVTTGPMTVPFIMALGVGAASVRASKNAQADSFGLIAMASVGPIIAVLLLALVYRQPASGALAQAAGSHTAETGYWPKLMSILLAETRNVSVALAPTVVIFAVMQAVFIKLPRRQLAKVAFGMGYTFIGITLLLTGVSAGFSPAAKMIGGIIASGGQKWLLVPIGLVLGLAVVFAEPAVHVLVREVEEVSSGYVQRRLLLISLSISVAVSVGLAMTRVLTGVSLWWFLVPGYTAAFLLTTKSPPLFTAISFDSGGVATGPMTVTFILAMAAGAAERMGGNVMADAFGLVALVAMMPIITIQLLGYLYARKERRIMQLETEQIARAGELRAQNGED